MKGLFSMVAVCASMFVGVAAAQDSLSDHPNDGDTGRGEVATQEAGAPIGGLTFFGDRPTFDIACPGLPIEDWEDFQVGFGGNIGCPSPANSTTSCADGYNAGDILAGIELLDTVGPSGNGLVMLGSSFNGNPSIQFGSNTFVDGLVINFSPTVTGAGMEIACHFSAATATIEIFDGGGASLGTTTSGCSNAGTFWGVSFLGGIGSILIEDLTDVNVEQIDNVAFGNAHVPVSLQSIDIQ